MKSLLCLREQEINGTAAMCCCCGEHIVGQVPHDAAVVLRTQLDFTAAHDGVVPATVRIRSIQRDKDSKGIVGLKVRPSL